MKFGPEWDPHIALGEMLKWYQLPSDLQREVDAYQPRPEDAQPLPQGKFNALMKRVEAFTDASVKGWTLPAHNPGHFEDVRRHDMELFDAYHGPKARTTYLFVRQADEMFSYAHDCNHCGSTLRIDHKTKAGRKLPLHLPGLGTNVSVEYVSAIAINDLLRKEGVPLPWRVFGTGKLWASTFGHAQAKANNRSFVPPNPQPNTFYHAKMRVADAMVRKSFEDSIDYAARVNFGEMPATGKQLQTVEEFRDSQIGYMRYNTHCHDELDRIARKSITGRYRKIIAAHATRLQEIKDGKDLQGLKILEDAMKKWSQK